MHTNRSNSEIRVAVRVQLALAQETFAVFVISLEEMSKKLCGFILVKNKGNIWNV